MWWHQADAIMGTRTEWVAFWAALLGAAIGAVATLLAGLIQNWQAAKRERREWGRQDAHLKRLKLEHVLKRLGEMEAWMQDEAALIGGGAVGRISSPLTEARALVMAYGSPELQDQMHNHYALALQCQKALSDAHSSPDGSSELGTKAEDLVGAFFRRHRDVEQDVATAIRNLTRSALDAPAD